MGVQVVKNWSPRKIIHFLKKNGFVDSKIHKGDHCGLYNPETKAYVEVDQGRDAFTKREMSGFIKASGISEKYWIRGKKIKR